MKQVLLALLLFPAGLFAQSAPLPIQQCIGGASQAAVSGLLSTNYQQAIIPSCTVTVYLTGTTTIATTTPQTPLTASSTGQFLINAPVGNGYDITLSGGIAPNTYPAPVTFSGFYPSAAGPYVSTATAAAQPMLQLTGAPGNLGWTALGDSLTAGNQGLVGVNFPAQLAALGGFPTNNLGIGGQTSTQIRARVDPTVSQVTITGGTIPACNLASAPCTGVTVTFTTGAEPAYGATSTYSLYGCPSGGVYGSIGGVAGCAVDNGSHVYTFTPTVTTGAVTPGVVYWTPILGTLLTGYVSIEAGRNNYTATATVEADIAAMYAIVKAAGGKPIVFDVLNGEYASEWSSGASYSYFTTLTNYLSALYGSNFFGYRAAMVNSCAPSSPTISSCNAMDKVDYANSVPPYSKRAVVSTSTTTLNGAITSGATSIAMNPGVTVLEAYQILLIDSEWIQCTGYSAGSYTGCTRGLAGSTAAAHANLAPVTVTDNLHQGTGYIYEAQNLLALKQAYTGDNIALGSTQINQLLSSFSPQQITLGTTLIQDTKGGTLTQQPGGGFAFNNDVFFNGATSATFKGTVSFNGTSVVGESNGTALGVNGSIYPFAANTSYLGASTLPWAGLYNDGAMTIPNPFGGGLLSATVSVPGSGWAVGDQCSVAGGTGGLLTINSVTSGAVNTVSVSNASAGTGYSSASGANCTAVSPSVGTGLQVNTTIGSNVATGTGTVTSWIDGVSHNFAGLDPIANCYYFWDGQACVTPTGDFIASGNPQFTSFGVGTLSNLQPCSYLGGCSSGSWALAGYTTNCSLTTGQATDPFGQTEAAAFVAGPLPSSNYCRATGPTAVASAPAATSYYASFFVQIPAGQVNQTGLVVSGTTPTGGIGSTFTINAFNNSCSGTAATITLTVANSWSGATVALSPAGTGCTAAPTSATCTVGTGTYCTGTSTSGTVTITSTLVTSVIMSEALENTGTYCRAGTGTIPNSWAVPVGGSKPKLYGGSCTPNTGDTLAMNIYNFGPGIKAYISQPSVVALSSTVTSTNPQLSTGIGAGIAATYGAALNGSIQAAQGTTTNALTMNNAGTGAASGSTFNGAIAKTLSYNTLGAIGTPCQLTVPILHTGDTNLDVVYACTIPAGLLGANSQILFDAYGDACTGTNTPLTGCGTNTGTCKYAVTWYNNATGTGGSGNVWMPGATIALSHNVRFSGTLSNENSTSAQAMSSWVYSTTVVAVGPSAQGSLSTASATYVLFQIQNSVSADNCTLTNVSVSQR